MTQIKQATVEEDLLTGPSSTLVSSTLLQMSKIAGFIKIFGKYTVPSGKVTDENQRWADYQRFDWSIRQLPAICVFESDAIEQKDSDEAFLKGMVRIMIVWPPSFRRPDARRVEVAFKGALQNFFSSQYVQSMLDELYYIQRPEKVPGLNEYGKTMTWTPNTHTIIENEACPVTIVDANYRIDLRSWYRTLEYQGRTRQDPFDVTLAELTTIGTPGEYDGKVKNDSETKVSVPDQITVSNP